MVSRRDFLLTAAAGTAALSSSPIWSSPPNADQNWIDAHVHVWTPDTKSYPLSPRFKQEDMAPPSFTPEQLFAHTKPNGVSRIVLIQMNFYEFDNRYMLDTMEKYPGVFGGVGIVDEDDGQVIANMKRLGDKKVRGFRIYADKQNVNKWQTSSGMKSMWTHAADSGQAMCCLANPDALPGIIQLCERFPKTPVVIDHFARIGVSGTIEKNDLDNLCRLASFANTYVKTSAFYALGKKQAPHTDLGDMIQRLVREFGANRLMWASDCPYQVQKEHNYASSIGLIRDKLAFLTEEDKNWLLRKTAEKVFF